MKSHPQRVGPHGAGSPPVGLRALMPVELPEIWRRRPKGGENPQMSPAKARREARKARREARKAERELRKLQRKLRRL